MEYVYAAMLLHKAGKPIDEENITKVLQAAGVNVDQSRVKALIAAISEVNIEEAIKSAPFFMPAAAITPSVVPSAPAAEEKPKEEKKEEKKEEEALEGLGALFG